MDGDAVGGSVRMRPVRSFGEITVFKCPKCGNEERAHPEHRLFCDYCSELARLER